MGLWRFLSTTLILESRRSRFRFQKFKLLLTFFRTVSFPGAPRATAIARSGPVASRHIPSVLGLARRDQFGSVKQRLISLFFLRLHESLTVVEGMDFVRTRVPLVHLC